MAFDGKPDWKEPPKILSGSELLDQLKDVATIYKKEDVLAQRERLELEKRKKKERMAVIRKEKCSGKRRLEEETGHDIENDKQHNWKKRSCFWELPYWEHLLIRHNLDGMHIKKNVCDNVLFTMTADKLKSKDNLNSRLDLQVMNIRKPLHPKVGPTGRRMMPLACFTMNKLDKDIFFKVLKNVKVPDGYASNISRCVNLKEHTIRGLKSHDSHVLMQQLLPIAIRGTNLP